MQKYDVIAVNIETKAERFLAKDKTRKAADGIVNMAVFRRGLEEEFYKKVPSK